MVASLLGFAHRNAKDESRGVFRGFPSYWNLYAIYAGVFSTQISPWLTAITVWGLAVLTVCPVWVLYPNLAPRPWRRVVFIGGLVWTAALVAILCWNYPSTPMALVIASLTYPAFYAIASMIHAKATAR